MKIEHPEETGSALCLTDEENERHDVIQFWIEGVTQESFQDYYLLVFCCIMYNNDH
jgi:hypothetical protein